MMGLVSMRCHNCGGSFELDLDDLQVYCPYCGQKLLIDIDDLGRLLSEKEKTKRAIHTEEEHTKRKKMKYEYKSREKERDWRKTIAGTLLCVVISILFFYLIPTHIFDSDRKKHDEKVAYLQELEAQIDEDIKNSDYESALLNVNKLYLDDGWSNDQAKTWDAKRESYLDIIAENKKAADIKNPDNIFVGTTSSNLKGENYESVRGLFEELGFTDVTAKVSPEKKGLFDKKDSVEHILINGKTDFTEEDYFDKDTPIIIYYYSE